MPENTPISPTPAAPVIKPVKPTNSPLTVFLLLVILLLLGATAFFGYQNMQLQKQISGMKIATSPTPIATSNSTANWKTYIDPKGKFTFKYPENLSNKDLGNGVISFVDSQNNTKFNLTGFRIGLSTEEQTFTVNKKVFIDNNNREWITDILLGEVYNFVGVLKLADKTYIVNLQSGPEYLTNPSNDGSNFRNFADQILSTFQFTSSTSTIDTSTWKTFSSNGFSFKYSPTLTNLGNQGGVTVPLETGAQTVVNFGDKTTISPGTDAPYDGFSVFVTGKSARQTLTEYVSNRIKEQKNSPRGIQSEKITDVTVDGHPAAYVEYSNDIREYFIQPTDPTAVVVFVRINKTNTFPGIFDQILSTFKFTQ